MSLSIVSNGHYRDLKYWWEMTEKQVAEAKDFIGDSYQDERYFIYKGKVYATCEFARVEEANPLHQHGWHFFYNDSMCSGVVFKEADPKRYNPDLDGKIVVGWFCS